MRLTPKINKAINKAAELHRHQIRKDVDIPYIMHPFSVAIILSNYTSDEDVIIAGLMHDTVEDVRGYTFKKLAKDFGARVAGIVQEVSEDKTSYYTKDKEKKTWYIRKKKYISGLETASTDALLVAAADKIHNINSLIESYENLGGRLWKNFNAPEPKRDYLWFYSKVLDVLEKRLKSDIVKELKQGFRQLDSLFKT